MYPDRKIPNKTYDLHYVSMSQSSLGLVTNKDHRLEIHETCVLITRFSRCLRTAFDALGILLKCDWQMTAIRRTHQKSVPTVKLLNTNSTKKVFFFPLSTKSKCSVNFTALIMRKVWPICSAKLAIALVTVWRSHLLLALTGQFGTVEQDSGNATNATWNVFMAPS